MSETVEPQEIVKRRCSGHVCSLFTNVPDLARASLSLGLFMSQDEAKLQPVKEGRDGHGPTVVKSVY